MTAALPISLDAIPLFEDLSPKKRDALSAMCTVRRYAAGDVVVPAGVGANGEVAFVMEGSVRVGAAMGAEGRITFEDIGPGGHYGALNALDPKLPLGSVIAREDTRLAIIPAAEFVRVLAQNGKAAVSLCAIWRAASRRRRSARTRVKQAITFSASTARSCLAEPSPEGDGSWLVNPMPKHRELADRAETTEENAASAIAHLIRVGLARRRYPALELVDRARIRALCDLR